MTLIVTCNMGGEAHKKDSYGVKCSNPRPVMVICEHRTVAHRQSTLCLNPVKVAANTPTVKNMEWAEEVRIVSRKLEDAVDHLERAVEEAVNLFLDMSDLDDLAERIETAASDLEYATRS